MEEFKEAPPGEILPSGAAATPPRQAASVVVVRGGEETLEVLLVQRTHEARFMGGVWVFPGGAVDIAEGDGDASHRAAAVRELAEEASVFLSGPVDLVKYSRWITPSVIRTRFDTHFFLAPMPAGQAPKVDGAECIDLGWFTPQGALDAHRDGRIQLVFPTIKHLEQFAAFDTARALLDYAATKQVTPITPRVLMEGEVARIVLPGEPGYDTV